MNFANLTGLSDSYGNVTQIADAAGVVLWSAVSDKVILEVEKITSDTYAGETTYTGEQFILLDIYPKTNGTVSVTYGGLTKTITDTSGAAEPNAQQVFFGTFNGVSDSVATPASGELTIEGDYAAFGGGRYSAGKLINKNAICITDVVSFGDVILIPDYAFSDSLVAGCHIESIALPNTVKSIGYQAFYYCRELASCILPDSLETIGVGAFEGCISLVGVSIPVNVSRIDSNAFSGVSNISVDSRNALYKIDGNCLVEVDTNRLICGFADSVIPVYIESIDVRAFAFNNIIKTVIVPENVSEIGYDAFCSCANLTKVTVLATTPPEAHSSGTFTGSDALTTIVVPVGCGEAYKAAKGWNLYADKIVEAS